MTYASGPQTTDFSWASVGRYWGAIVLTCAMGLTGCAGVPKLVTHAFSFDGWYDGWAEKVDLLAYSYGDQYHMVRRAAEGDRYLGYRTGVNGPMPVGDFLFVKWRLKASGEVFEHRVSLRDRLPRDMSDHELTFVIDGRELYVYVVTPLRKNAHGDPPNLKTWRSNFAHAYEVHPVLQKP